MRLLGGSAALAAAVVMLQAPAFSAERSHARSMVITRQGIVATGQALASQAGAQVLAQGGSAVDAAIAAGAVMGVVEPMSCGIGGDLLAIYWDAKSGTLTGLNASGWAPKGLSIDFLESKKITSMPREGIHTVTVPGCVDGWEKLHKRFGRLRWAELFRPAIYYASNGFRVTELVSQAWRDSISELSRDAIGRPIFLPDGAAPAAGAVFRNADLAKALQQVAKGGAAAFYRGEITKAILLISEWDGGTLNGSDFAEFASEWVTPIATDYRGWKVYELPPNGSGVAALEMLNIMEVFPLPKVEPLTAGAFHLKIESQKLASQDLARYVADPRLAKIPLADLLSKQYAARQAAQIDPARANCSAAARYTPAAEGGAIYLSVVDRDGNIASLVQSLGRAFGSEMTVPGMGFHLHNQGAQFTLDREHPNALAPRKRPLYTSIPAFMEQGSVHIGFGIGGGLNPAQAQAQFISNVVDYGMDIQAALEAPRFTRADSGGCKVSIEGRVPAEVREALTQRGHKLDVRGAYDDAAGGGQAVLRDSSSGVNYGASSTRKDGAAATEPAPNFAETAPKKK